MPSSDPPTAVEQSKLDVPDVSKTQSQPQFGTGKAPKQQEPGAPTDVPKLSGAELKKQAKADKAARRAQALQAKQTGASAPQLIASSNQSQKSDVLKDAKSPQRKGGAVAAADARYLPARGGQQKTAPVTEIPKGEDKTVEFFRHLYKTRTTSIAGAGKEVHPAVLALGLQMSNYTICGSCARLVATLQAFKRASSSPEIFFS